MSWSAPGESGRTHCALFLRSDGRTGDIPRGQATWNNARGRAAMTVAVRFAVVTLCAVLASSSGRATPQAPASTPQPFAASVCIDATKIANRIDPQLYGHFLEFMFEGIKSGLHAELLKNRGFEETASPVGLPRDWEREPNDRNDDREATFARDAEVAYAPQATPFPADASAHALRLVIKARYDGPRGVRQ